MPRRVACLLLVSLLLPASHAEETVRSAQEELRRRNIYFGDIDGRRTSEFEEAMKRYQRRKGFTPNGREDPDTLRSLGLLARSPGEPPPKDLEELPEMPVLKSDARVDVGAAAGNLAQTTGIASVAVAPLGTTKTPAARSTRSSRSARAAVTVAAAETPVVPAKVQRTLTQPEVQAYVKEYLKACERSDLKRELGFYADRVDYLGNGTIDRRIIEHSLLRYYAQWPKHAYGLVGFTGYSVNRRRAEITVTYQVKFSLKRGGTRASGTTQNRMVINAATASPRIVAIRESRVRQ